MSLTNGSCYEIDFPEMLAIDPRGDQFRENVLPQFHGLLVEAGFSLDFIRQDTKRFLNDARVCFSPMRVRFDMSKTTYVGLSEILKVCVMGTLCKELTNRKVELIPPRDRRVADFLARVGFYRDLFNWGELPKNVESSIEDLLATSYDEPSEFLVPITRIRNDRDVSVAANHFSADNNIEKLLRHAWIRNADRNELEYVVNEMAGTLLGEIGENIHLHSLSTGYIVAQSQRLDPNATKDDVLSPKVIIAISDGGIGIVQSLREKDLKKYASKTSEQILEMVISGDVPKGPGEDRGGIKRAHDLIRDKFRGELHIKTAFTEYSLWYNRLVRPFRKDHDKNFFIGTHVVMKLPRYVEGAK